MRQSRFRFEGHGSLSMQAPSLYGTYAKAPVLAAAVLADGSRMYCPSEVRVFGMVRVATRRWPRRLLELPQFAPQYLRPP